jgi:hypothetical protein
MLAYVLACAACDPDEPAPFAPEPDGTSSTSDPVVALGTGARNTARDAGKPDAGGASKGDGGQFASQSEAGQLDASNPGDANMAFPSLDSGVLGLLDVGTLAPGSVASDAGVTVEAGEAGEAGVKDGGASDAKAQGG